MVEMEVVGVVVAGVGCRITVDGLCCTSVLVVVWGDAWVVNRMVVAVVAVAVLTVISTVVVDVVAAVVVAVIVVLVAAVVMIVSVMIVVV